MLPFFESMSFFRSRCEPLGTRGLVKRALIESLYRDLFQKSCQETSYRELVQKSCQEVSYIDLAKNLKKREFVQRFYKEILPRDIL